MPVIALVGTMDTKADELGHVAGEVRRLGHQPLLVDVGTGGPPGIVPDISPKRWPPRRAWTWRP